MGNAPTKLLMVEDEPDIANALAAYDPDDSMTRAVLDRLYEMRVEEDGVVDGERGTQVPPNLGTGRAENLDSHAAKAFRGSPANCSLRPVSRWLIPPPTQDARK